ncbi:ABC transporter ATP-binding protein [Paenibacillus sp. NPDC058071]|uniref:ABC transporter ATP-binding protein n=1 Tax=Paenibacillus sp. NPDC058071 TaxID=3346326 RepID=UPI0036DC35A2
MEIYRIQDVSFTFPLQEKPALSHIELTIPSGQFVTICGRSGCGKSTLLRQLKPILSPHGDREGEIYYNGRPIGELGQREQASQIGFVLQHPDNAVVTEKVWHELAFGLESLGLDSSEIRLRTAEMASFFGIHTWFHRKVSELSGGQKQLLQLASIMTMQPSVLLLDEPTSQLDPIAAAEFLDTIRKINRELGTTIIMTEHRLEDALPAADRLIVLDNGAVVADDTPGNAGRKLFQTKHPIFAAMPSPMQIYAGVDGSGDMPVTVKEGRQWLDNYMAARTGAVPDKGQTNDDGTALAAVGDAVSKAAIGSKSSRDSDRKAKENQHSPAIRFKDVWFRYEKNGSDIVKDLSFEVEEGGFYCLVGGNGAGKSTALSLASGMLSPYRGKVLIGGRDLAAKGGKGKDADRMTIAMLPQNPQHLFVKKTVRHDLLEAFSGERLSVDEVNRKVDDIVAFMELEPLLERHPYDLSGGEQQRAALAKVLLLEPRILLLDEPTKGLDGHFKERLAGLLTKLCDGGLTVVMVSHDVEFCAKHGRTCAMFFDGGIAAENEAKPFFAGNSFYTTAANRMSRHLWNGSVTVEDVIAACGEAVL